MMAAAFRYDGDEYDVAGSLRGARFRGEGAYLRRLVPATSEIVIEGEVIAGERQMEGPMAEFTGHYSGATPSMSPGLPPSPIARSDLPDMNGGGYEHVSVGNMIPRAAARRFVRHMTPRMTAVHLPPYARAHRDHRAENPQPVEARNVGSRRCPRTSTSRP